MPISLVYSGNEWWLLQGNKEETYQLGQKSYLVAVKQDDGTPGGYVHQGWFVLVDKAKTYTRLLRWHRRETGCQVDRRCENIAPGIERGYSTMKLGVITAFSIVYRCPGILPKR
jgi:hypothetical protein